ncbi:MAG: hypothetical protein Q4B01_00730 [Eubacteriales bacterium]|nr:hypothetical protein [Eubacteriales bacterium]
MHNSEWKEQVKKKAAEADMLLIGIGPELSLKKHSREELLAAYHEISKLAAGKPWFAITLNTDDVIYESELNRMFIVAPCGSDASGNVITNENYDESEYLPQWEFYRNYLSATIGKKLCILEFGVGMEYPSVVRMPFERLVQWNQKAELVRVHKKLAFVPPEAEERSLCIAEDAQQFLTQE